MNSYAIIFINTVLVNNFVLVKLLGICPFIGVSRKIETTLNMSLAIIFVMILSSICIWCINNFILIPLNAPYLRTLVYILVIAIIAQFIELITSKTNPTIYRLFNAFLPLITTNSTILGVTLLNTNQNYNFVQTILFGFSAAISFSLIMVLFAAIRERLEIADVPTPFKGSAIALITAGLMSLAFMGFSGLVKA